MRSFFGAQKTLPRRTIAGAGVLVFGLVFHVAVTRPFALAKAEAPKGWQRLQLAFGRPSLPEAGLFSAPPPTSLFGDDFAAQAVPPAVPAGGSPGQIAQSPAEEGAKEQQIIADPALLEALQAALREKRDAEYIDRLRRFHRKLAVLVCPPLPSYSLKNLSHLSDSERYTAACHERAQLQAQCVIPASLFEPMRCPQGYEWDLSEQWQEDERKWLAERTRKADF